MGNDKNIGEPRVSAGEAGVIIETAQGLILAGVRNNDSESINAGLAMWGTVWPPDVVKRTADLLIQDETGILR